MWEIDNETPFAAEKGWCRDRDGGELWLTVVKATYEIHPDGTTSLAGEQTPPLLEAEWRGEPGKSSLRYDCDMVRTKATTDVILNGSAHAPGGKPVERIEVAFRVDDLQRSALVVGDRVFERGLGSVRPGRPQPFLQMPITFERAFGGDEGHGQCHLENPVGTGFASSPASLLGKPAPNVQPLGNENETWNKTIGFGIVGPHWLPRRALGGTYDARWAQQRSPLVPDDFDDTFFQVAPVGQRTPRPLRGGETVALLNLTPSGRLSFRLPRVALGLRTEFRDSLEDHAASLHTVIIEPDAPRVILVWQSALRCHGRVEQLQSTRVWEKEILSDQWRQDDPGGRDGARQGRGDGGQRLAR